MLLFKPSFASGPMTKTFDTDDRSADGWTVFYPDPPYSSVSGGLWNVNLGYQSYIQKTTAISVGGYVKITETLSNSKGARYWTQYQTAVGHVRAEFVYEKFSPFYKFYVFHNGFQVYSETLPFDGTMSNRAPYVEYKAVGQIACGTWGITKNEKHVVAEANVPTGMQVGLESKAYATFPTTKYIGGIEYII